MKWDVALNAANKCREAGYSANNKAISDYWYETADKIEDKYIAGQPWLRTHDGKLN